jgi:hypothetical protein
VQRCSRISKKRKIASNVNNIPKKKLDNNNSHTKSSKHDIGETEATNGIQNSKPTLDFLNNMTVEKLVKYAQSKGLRRRKKSKKELIEYILRELNPTDEGQELVSNWNKLLDNNKSTDEPHIFYRKHFNVIDLFNRLMYDFDDQHPIINWRSKYCICLLRANIVNFYVCENEYTRQNWKVFYANFLNAMEDLRL